MTEFKIGDKVRLIVEKGKSLYGHCFGLGACAKVVQADKDEVTINAVHRGKLVNQVVHPSELELINE